MAHRYDFKRSPVADAKAVIQGECYRFTVLTSGVIRYEWSDKGEFEDRASTFALNRHQPVPEFRVNDRPNRLEIVTSRLALYFDKQDLDSLSVQAKGVVTGSEGRWYYNGHANNPERGNLQGTIKTLDGVDGPTQLGPGVLSHDSFAHLDDSDSLVFEQDGWLVPRQKAHGRRADGYIFAYGADYKQALEAFYEISGREPLLPRWAFGNWWSRYYKVSRERNTLNDSSDV